MTARLFHHSVYSPSGEQREKQPQHKHWNDKQRRPAHSDAEHRVAEQSGGVHHSSQAGRSELRRAASSASVAVGADTNGPAAGQASTPRRLAAAACLT